MNPVSSLLVVFVLTLAGCDSLADATARVREKIATREEGRTKTYAAPARTTYEAVRLAADHMGYRILRGGAAQGELEAVNGVASDDALRGARQIRMKVKLHATGDATTEVTIHLTEILEGDTSPTHPALATETPLKDTPQYQVFFRSVQESLDGLTAPVKK